MGAVDKKAPGKIQQEKLSVVTALNGCKKDESRNETEKPTRRKDETCTFWLERRRILKTILDKRIKG